MIELTKSCSETKILVIKILKHYIIDKINWINLSDINFNIIIGIRDFILKNGNYIILENLYRDCFF